MVGDNGTVFGKRGQVLVPSDAVWDYDERNRRVANAALDAELVFGQATLIDGFEEAAMVDELAFPPPIEARCRVGDLVAAFTIVRQPVRIFGGPREEPSDAVWWCVDYNAMRLRVGPGAGLIAPSDIAPTSWDRFDSTLRKGLYRFIRLRSGYAGMVFTFCVGGNLDGAWYSKMFRSFGYSAWFRPRSIQHLTEYEAMHEALPVLPPRDWSFETQPVPRITHRPTGDRLSYEPGPIESVFYLAYEGQLGVLRFRVVAHELWGWGSRPQEWDVDTGAPLELRYGSPRNFGSPGVVGEARLSEAEWNRLNTFLKGALLRWPSCEATRQRPVWLQFSGGGYEEGAWRSAVPWAIGLNADLTRLLDSRWEV